MKLKRAVLELLALFSRYIYRLCFVFSKIKQSQILFSSFRGRRYFCNPKYITEYFLKNTDLNKYKIIWVCKNSSDAEYLKSKGIIVISNLFSIQYVKALLTSSVIVENCLPVQFYVRRPGQIYIETWHGGGCYKKIGVDVKNKSSLTKYLIGLSVKQISHFISSSEFFSDNVIKESLGFTDTILDCGMPRNDVLVKGIIDNKKKFFEVYNIPAETKLVLFAPTFRDNNPNAKVNMDFEQLLGALEKRFCGKWIALYRCHVARKSLLEKNSNVIDVSDYQDMQELLAYSDVLISDYSSSIWDYSLTHKPCFLYCPDIKDYCANRDFCKDIRDWHFPLAENIKQLCECIEDFNINDFVRDMNLHHKELKSFEKGNSCNTIFEFIDSNSSKCE